mgnify:CR=1 FL=1
MKFELPGLSVSCFDISPPVHDSAIDIANAATTTGNTANTNANTAKLATDRLVATTSNNGSTWTLAGNNTNASTEPKSGQSLYNFKLVGVVSSEIDSFATLINAGGDVLTLKVSEELSPGVKLVALNNKEAVFETEGASYLVINFKNQIVERAR